MQAGVLEAEARALNAPFLTRLKENRPFVIAKWAQSLDGCVATASGESKWISGKGSRLVGRRAGVWMPSWWGLVRCWPTIRC